MATETTDSTDRSETTNADIKTLFRKLVTNQFMPDLDYANTKFTFKTVFSTGKYTYCCCSCGFEHEYLDYVGNNGEINEVMYDKIVNSIVDGRCPHVNEANEEDIAETGIYGISIALSLGTEAVVNRTDFDVTERCGSLFQVDPFRLAVKKNISSFLVSAVHFCHSPGKRLLDPERSPGSINEVYLSEKDVLQLCIANANEKILEEVPLYGNVSSGALRSAFQRRNDRILDAVLQKADLDNHRTEWTSHECCRLSIIYNRPTILQTHLVRFSSTFHIVRTSLENMLYTFCILFERPQCKEVILKYIKYEQKELPVSELVVQKLLLLLEFYSDDLIRSEILASLKHVKDKGFSSLSKDDFLKMYSARLDYKKPINGAAFNTILDIASDFFQIPHNDISHLDTLLGKRFSMGPGYRQILEMLLFQNVDFGDDLSIFLKALEVDHSLENTSYGRGFGLHNFLIMDSTRHAMFRHDDERDFALNFTAPLLIECGGPYSFDVYSTFISRYNEDALQTAEKDFLCEVKNTQKTLTILCRDVLRRHFRGTRIIRYVNHCNIPQKIRDFILLRNILKYIPAEMVC